MELYSGAHLIELEIIGRPLRLPLLIEDGQALLIDSGTRQHAAEEIPAYLAEVGIGPSDLKWLILTHPDADHCSGAGEIARRFPTVRVACGAADRELIESRDRLSAVRFSRFSREHGIAANELTAADPAWYSDYPFQLSSLAGGETLHLGNNRTVEIWHLPGHSDGHLAVYDRKYRTLFYGDALQGSGYQSLTGAWVLCPIYTSVDSYLQTIARVEACAAETLVGCHWPIYRGHHGIKRFCSETREFVDLSEKLIRDYLRAHSAGATLRELCSALGGQFDKWPSGVNIRLAFAFASHLEHAVLNGGLEADRSTRPVVFRQT